MMISRDAQYPIEYLKTKIGDIESLIPEYQRLYVWKLDRQSKFIRHILNDYPTHKVFIDNRKDEWSILDGQQRLTTVMRFINDDFRLDSCGKGTQEWSNKLFSELDKGYQKLILNYTFSCEMIECASEEEIEGLFDGLNSGMPLGKITEVLLRNISVKKIINEIKLYPFISDIILNMSHNELSKQEDDLLVLRIIAMFSEGVISLDGDSLEEFLNNVDCNKIKNDIKPLIFNTTNLLSGIKTEGVFGYRKPIASHTIPLYIYYANERFHNGDTLEQYKSFTKILTSSRLDEMRLMNKSDTTSKRKQIERLKLFDSINQERA